MASAKIDLSLLASPNVVEALSFNTILAAMLADLQARALASGYTYTALVESDPAFKIMEVCAYREMLIRQRVNDACRGIMLAYAVGPDLDQLGANWNLSRNVITPADNTTFPPTPAVLENDSDFRARIQLAPEALSVAGPVGAYVFWAKTVSDVLDVSVESPTPGAVVLSILSRANGGLASDATLSAVRTALEDVRPLTDQLTVSSATLVNYAIAGTIFTYDGPDPATVIADAGTSAATYAANQKRLGLDITLSGIYAALHRPGVQRVELDAATLAQFAPLTMSIVIGTNQAGNCTAINLTNGGIAQ